MGQKAKYAPPSGHVRSDLDYGSDAALSPKAARPARPAETDRDVEMTGASNGANRPRRGFLIMNRPAASMDRAFAKRRSVISRSVLNGIFWVLRAGVRPLAQLAIEVRAAARCADI
jgi:hypothetical protein